VWRRCADCPAVTEKTRMELADARPVTAGAAVASHIGTMKEAAALPSRLWVQGLPRTELHFALKSVRLSLAEQETLRSWVASWGPNPAAQLRITAYAENSRASRDLSDVRGREVQVALWRLGIPFTQFERTVEVVNDPAGRVAIEVTRIPSGEAPAAPRVVPTPKDAGTRPARPKQARAHSLLHHGASP